MKRISLILVFLMVFLVLTSCQLNNYNAVVIEDDYEYVDANWTPIGVERKAGKFITFSGDKQMIFIKENSLFSEGVIYHKKSDNYPNITTSKITKVLLSEGDQRITVNQQYFKYFQKGFIDKAEEAKITRDELSANMLFVDLYFDNYPAYYTGYYFTKTISGVVVLRYCEEELNKKNFGDYNSSMIITDKALVDYLLEVL